MKARTATVDPPTPPAIGSDGDAPPSRWRAFLADWLRYAALGHDMPLLTAAELAYYTGSFPGKELPLRGGQVRPSTHARNE